MVDKKIVIACVAIVILIGSIWMGVVCGSKESFSSKTVYYFSNPSCPHCKNFDPIWDELVKKNPGLDMQKLNSNDPSKAHLFTAHNVRTAPTIVVVTPKGSKVFKEQRTIENLQKFIASR